MEGKYYLNEFQEPQKDPTFDINNAVNKAADIYGKYVELRQFEEIHKTRRKEIEAVEKTTIKDIEARKDLMIAYFDKIFQERSKQSDKWFKELDKAIETNNLDMIDRSCDAITSLGQSNPLSHLSKIEQSRRFLESDEEIDL